VKQDDETLSLDFFTLNSFYFSDSGLSVETFKAVNHSTIIERAQRGSNRQINLIFQLPWVIVGLLN